MKKGADPAQNQNQNQNQGPAEESKTDGFAQAVSPNGKASARYLWALRSAL